LSKAPARPCTAAARWWGLVNLITHSAKDGAASTAALALGSHASGKLYWSGKRQQHKLSSFVAASASYSGGRDLYLPEFDQPAFGAHFGGLSKGNDVARSVRLFGRFSAGPAWLQAMLVSGARRDPLASYGSSFNGRLTLRESLGALEASLTHHLSDGGQLSARLFSFATAERGDYPYASAGRRGMPATYINVSDLMSRQLGAELRYDRFISPGHHLLGGVEIKHIRYSHQVGDQPGLGRSDVFSVDSDSSYMQWALFAQDEMRLGAGKLFIGARLDSYHGFSEGVNSHVSPRIAYVQQVAKGVTAKLMYGEAYRAPTIYESRYQDGLPAASTIWANGALEPEFSRSLEALLIGQPASGVQWRLSGFLKRLQGTPIQRVTPNYRANTCTLGPDACIQYVNSDRRQKVAGVELDVRVRRGEEGELYASMVLQRGRGEGGELASSPERQFKAGISSKLPWPGANAALEAQYIGQVHGRIDSVTAVRDVVPSYLLVGAVLNATGLGQLWRASLRVDNLLDRRYGTVASRELQPLRRVPADGRRFAVQLQRDF